MPLFLVSYAAIVLSAGISQTASGDVQLAPEAVIAVLGPLVAFVVGALRSAFNPSDGALPLISIIVGIGLALLVYGGGFVEVQGGIGWVVVRATLAGISIAAGASGGQTWAKKARTAAVNKKTTDDAEDAAEDQASHAPPATDASGGPVGPKLD